MDVCWKRKIRPIVAAENRRCTDSPKAPSMDIPTASPPPMVPARCFVLRTRSAAMLCPLHRKAMFAELVL